MARKQLSAEDKALADERRLAALKELADMTPQYQEYLDKLSEKKRARLLSDQKKFRNGLHTIAPLICFGPSKCPFIHNCPVATRTAKGDIDYSDLSDYPMYQSCVYETLYMQQKVIDYVQHLEVDPHNTIEMAIVNDLAVIDLYKNRAMLVMAAGDKWGDGRDFLKIDIKTNQGEYGTLEERHTQLHPAALYIDTLEKRRVKLLEGLVETRRSRFDVAYKSGAPSTTSLLREEMAAIRKALEQNNALPISSSAVIGDKSIPITDDE
jgi:hypothetical protein